MEKSKELVKENSSYVNEIQSVNSEKQNFERLLARVVKGDELATGGDLPVLQGAVKLFQYLKETISRCATMSTGETLVSLVG